MISRHVRRAAAVTAAELAFAGIGATTAGATETDDPITSITVTQLPYHTEYYSPVQQYLDVTEMDVDPDSTCKCSACAWVGGFRL